MVKELHTIKSMGHKDLPDKTRILIRLGSIPGTVSVDLSLPGQRRPAKLEDLTIKDGVLVLPVPLVFLCHANEDKETVEAIDERLWQDGFVTWFSEKDLLPGDDWKAKINEAIEVSDRVLVFVSRHSISKTSYVQREIRYALEQQKLRPPGERYIIPVIIEECFLPREFKDIHWVRLWDDDWYNSLTKALRK